MKAVGLLRVSVDQRGRGNSIFLLVCSLAASALISTGCGDYSGGDTDTSVLGNQLGSAALPGGLSVSDQVTSFETTVYPLLAANCSECHISGRTQPNIADPNVTVAWSSVVNNQKVNFASPSSSRIVSRLSSDRHNCWSDCTADGAEMLNAILAWQTAIESAGGNTGGVNVSGLTSDTKTLLDGTEDQGDERYNNNIIALWKFQEGSGTVAFDSSGVAPAMDLTLEGATFLSSYGIDTQDGRAIATRSDSRKLYDQIANPLTGTQQYTVEAWIAPANTTQDEDRRVFSYGRNSGSHNFMLGQNLYQYLVRNRSMAAGVSNNGTPSLETYDVDQDAQATLQHVVVTYNQIEGRRIYVNGRWTDDSDPIPASELWTWDPDAQFAVGNESNSNSTQRRWLGQMRHLAIYRESLSPVHIAQNFAAGTGRRVTLAFDVSQWTGGSSQIEFAVTELDNYSYLFCQPTLVTNTGSAIRVDNMRISINGAIPNNGQGFSNLNALTFSPRQQLSRQCSIIGGKVDSSTDTFSLAFENLGLFNEPFVEPAPVPGGGGPYKAPYPQIGVRDFARVNASFSELTGVDPLENEIRATYLQIEAALAGTTNVSSFLASHQMAAAKLALEYCDALVENASYRTAFFGTPNPGTEPNFSWTAPAATAFATAPDVDFVTDAILDGFLGSTDVNLRGERATVEADLDALLGLLQTNCGGSGCGGAAQQTMNITKGLCQAVLGSAVINVH